MSWMVRVQFQISVRVVFLFHGVLTSIGAHASYIVGTRGSFPGEFESDHSSPSSAVAKSNGVTTSLSISLPLMLHI
jgi:hypothetical protein